MDIQNSNLNSCALEKDNQNIYFWIKQMKEHSGFIKTRLHHKNIDLRETAEEFSRKFDNLFHLPVNNQILILVIREFIFFQKEILTDIIEFHSNVDISPSFLDSLIQEAKYFLSILRTDSKREYKISIILKNSEFWFHMIKNHINFLNTIIDQSQNLIIYQLRHFNDILNALCETASSFNMLDEYNPMSFNGVFRLIADSKIILLDISKFLNTLSHDAQNGCILTNSSDGVDIIQHFEDETNNAIEYFGKMSRCNPICRRTIKS